MFLRDHPFKLISDGSVADVPFVTGVSDDFLLEDIELKRSARPMMTKERCSRSTHSMFRKHPVQFCGP